MLSLFHPPFCGWNKDIRPLFCPSSPAHLIRILRLLSSSNSSCPFHQHQLFSIQVCIHQEGGVYIVAASAHDGNAALMVEALRCLGSSLKDYLGVEKLHADDMVRHMASIYALLDEMIDAGYPQMMTTAVLQHYIAETGDKQRGDNRKPSDLV